MAASTNSSCAPTVGRLERSRPSRALSARTTWQTRSWRQPAGNLVDRRYWVLGIGTIVACSTHGAQSLVTIRRRPQSSACWTASGRFAQN
jgi:hypothetical protein